MKNTNWLAIVVAILLIILVVWAIVSQVREHHQQDDPKLKELRKLLEPFFDNNKPSKGGKKEWAGHLSKLNHENPLDKISLYKGKKSYTINKEKVFLCLKDEKGDYYNTNLLMYVTLHEISHVICESIGHTQEFHDIFEALLGAAAAEGIYNPNLPIDPEYCTYSKDD